MICVKECITKQSIMKKNKETFAIDFTTIINKQWYEDSAENHIDSWKDRYKEYTRKSEVSFDLNVNHDPSLEIEYAEQLLGRELTIQESNRLVIEFNNTVVKKINLKELKKQRKNIY